MAKIHKTTDGRYLFYCDGCKCHHFVSDRWTFNGNFESPTFSPSILVRGTEYTKKGWDEYDEWTRTKIMPPSGKFETKPTVCHSFVRDGKIEYLSDCTHELAEQTVELEDLDVE
jgi:hypothetical protein